MAEKAAKRPPTQYETRTALYELSEALDSLKRFLDPDDESCSVPAEARKHAQAYLGSWVESPIERAQEVLKRSQEGKRAARTRYDLHW